jgi:hypothetical protein
MRRSQSNFKPYLTYTDEQIWTRYSEVCSELANLRTELATMKAQEHRTKLNEFYMDDGASVAARSRAADYAASEITCTIIECEGHINALYEEQQFIDHLVREWNNAPGIRLVT